MTKEELEKATCQELIEQRDYCGADGYYGDYLDAVNAEMLKRFNRLEELERENAELKQEKIPQLERKIASIRGAHSVDCKKLNARLEQVKRLKKENAELKEEVSFVKDNLRVARKDRENLQLDVAKGLKEFVKDCPATALRYLANEKYVEQLTEAKELLRMVIDSYNHKERFSFEKDLIKVEQFLNEVSE